MTSLGPDQTVFRPVGPRAEGECAMNDDPDGPCFTRPSWRITPVQPDHTYRNDSGSGVTHTMCLRAEDPVRLACLTHLAHVITLTDEVYGGAVLVEVHHG